MDKLLHLLLLLLLFSNCQTDKNVELDNGGLLVKYNYPPTLFHNGKMIELDDLENGLSDYHDHNYYSTDEFMYQRGYFHLLAAQFDSTGSILFERKIPTDFTNQTYVIPYENKIVTLAHKKVGGDSDKFYPGLMTYNCKKDSIQKVNFLPQIEELNYKFVNGDVKGLAIYENEAYALCKINGRDDKQALVNQSFILQYNLENDSISFLQRSAIDEDLIDVEINQTIKASAELSRKDFSIDSKHLFWRWEDYALFATEKYLIAKVNHIPEKNPSGLANSKKQKSNTIEQLGFLFFDRESKELLQHFPIKGLAESHIQVFEDKLYISQSASIQILDFANLNALRLKTLAINSANEHPRIAFAKQGEQNVLYYPSKQRVKQIHE